MAPTTVADQYRLLLLARGNTEKHAADTHRRISVVLNLGQIDSFDKLNETRVLLGANQLRPQASLATVNHHLRAVKSFARFAVLMGFLPSNPIAALRLFNEALDVRHPRRAMSHAEQSNLILSTSAAKNAAGMSGPERALLYELALRTGLRMSELRGLERSDLQHRLGRWWLRARASISKNRKETQIPLSAEMGLRLARHCSARKMRSIFTLPSAPHVVRMLRADLRRAGIAYRNENGIADFHALRHTFITEISKIVADVKTVQLLARHSTIQLTFDRYVHRDQPELTHAIDQLSSLRTR